MTQPGQEIDEAAHPESGTESDPVAGGVDGAGGINGAPRRPALSPSRAADFKQCPLLYRFRAVDRLPEPPSRAQARGTVTHAVLERLFELPAARRRPDVAAEMVEPVWQEVAASDAEFAGLFDGPHDPDLADWLESVRRLLESYFAMEDPQRIEPEACELLLEAELTVPGLHDPIVLRGYLDRLDAAPTGDLRVVDYKSGAAPREVFEAKALFQMKFYALVLLRTRGVVPRQLRLMYLADGQSLVYTPDETELNRFERTLIAIWRAILKAADTGDFRPRRSGLCNWCEHQARCPEFGGTPPPYPGWPVSVGTETARDRAE